MSDIAELKMKVAMACRMLFVAELVDYSGHISIRIPGTDRFLIHGHPVSRCEVTPDDVVTVDIDGKKVEGKWNPPSELPMHIRTYRARSDVQSVAHLHNRMAWCSAWRERRSYRGTIPGPCSAPGRCRSTT